MEPVLKLIHVPGARRIAGLTKHDVQGATVQIAEVSSKAFRRSEESANLLHSCSITALGLWAGSSWHSDQELEYG